MQIYELQILSNIKYDNQNLSSDANISQLFEIFCKILV
jgi:hypothetical protein